MADSLVGYTVVTLEEALAPPNPADSLVGYAVITLTEPAPPGSTDSPVGYAVVTLEEEVVEPPASGIASVAWVDGSWVDVVAVRWDSVVSQWVE